MLDYIDVKVLDINSEALGVSAETLMENAGRALAHKLLDNFADIENILIVCGTGNNCGDGLVAARYLARRGMKIKIIFVRGMRRIKSELARRQLLRLQGIREITLLDYSPNSLNESLIWCNVVLDAMLGVGISGDVKEPYAGVIDALNKSGKPIIAVDVPSGLGTKSCVKAELTVTFHDVKRGMSPEYCGKIEVADIGIPKEAELYTGPGEFVYFPRPKKESHKGENGRLLIIGGGPYTGAPALSAIAAYRCGVDLVHILTREDVRGVIASYSPSLIVHGISSENYAEGVLTFLQEHSKRFDALLLGPGMGLGMEERSIVSAVLDFWEKPILIDADALKLVKGELGKIEGKPCVLTPHRGEFKLLSDLEATKENVVKFARSHNVVVLLKSAVDIITDGIRIKFNKTGNPAMSVGGTGDVLAGVAASLLARGLEPYRSAVLGAFITGTAGDMAYDRLSYALMAEDVVQEIPNVIKKYCR